MRSCPLNIPAIGRALGFVLAAAAAIVATAVHFHDADRSRFPALSSVAPHDDPLATALTRCQALGAVAEGDAACRAAWAENRRRFFGDQPAPEGR